MLILLSASEFTVTYPFPIAVMSFADHTVRFSDKSHRPSDGSGDCNPREYIGGSPLAVFARMKPGYRRLEKDRVPHRVNLSTCDDDDDSPKSPGPPFSIDGSRAVLLPGERPSRRPPRFQYRPRAFSRATRSPPPRSGSSMLAIRNFSD
ncbi:hypothetical protein [Burkholderia alba]|uniref:hypothetical protein n=1 Tax=Burkholderia alba TaxID=2683677 RepID=UPI002B05EF00|nr:hypothetical protein [Burkholderia alba]